MVSSHDLHCTYNPCSDSNAAFSMHVVFAESILSRNVWLPQGIAQHTLGKTSKMGTMLLQLMGLSGVYKLTVTTVCTFQQSAMLLNQQLSQHNPPARFRTTPETPCSAQQRYWQHYGCRQQHSWPKPEAWSEFHTGNAFPRQTRRQLGRNVAANNVHSTTRQKLKDDIGCLPMFWR